MADKTPQQKEFPLINRGYQSVFRAGRLSIGLVVPVAAYPRAAPPELHDQVERIQLAESLGFASVWLRDVPFHVPSFGDVGQIFDPFVYLGLLAGKTRDIALGVASIILPLRHPAHVAKAAASVDVLSEGRLLLGVASGDRPDEYPAMNIVHAERGERFRESFAYIEHMGRDWPDFDNAFGSPKGIDMLPKPAGSRLPLLITGGSQQTPDWIASHGDGRMLYPRGVAGQAAIISDWRARIAATGGPPKPVMQPLYIDLAEHPDAVPTPLHLGMRAGSNHLKAYLRGLRDVGVNHVALNLRFNRHDIPTTLRRLADEVLPEFHS